MDIILPLLGIVSFCGIPVLSTIFLTIRHYRCLRRFSYGTPLLAACSVPLLLVLMAIFIEPGVWFTQDGRVTLDGLSTALFCTAVMCILAGLSVVLHRELVGGEVDPV